MKKVYCDKCNKMTDYELISDQEMYSSLYDIYYKGTKCICTECNEEVHSNNIDFENLQKSEEAYNKQTITIDQIRALLYKYSIGATVLSNLLGWSDVTITRYLKGGKPLIKYSNALIELLNNPYKMYDLIVNNQEKMTRIGYEKALKSINDEINRFNISNELSLSSEYIDTNNEASDAKTCELYDIELIANYILSIKDLTPKALQKILYYAQGFYRAFNDLWLFNNIPQAWQHGPVYSNIFQNYKRFGFNPIVTNIDKTMYESKISKFDREFLNYILKYYGCYTGDTLEETSHSESPWRNARIGLKDNEPSNRGISMDDITDYFSAIKNRYNMIDYSDMKYYIVEKVFNII